MVDRHKPAWVKFGRELRRNRLQAGFSQDQVAQRVLLTGAMISAIERGGRGAKPEYVAQFDHLFSTGGALSDLWNSLNKNEGYPEWLRDIVTLEDRATEIREQQMVLIPGLLQTTGYTRALARAVQPSRTSDELQEVVDGRLRRQEILTRSNPIPPRLVAVLDEMVVRRPVGGMGIMREQLEHLLTMSELPRTTVQVVPFATELHPGLTGGFRLLCTEDGSEALYLEHAHSGTLIQEAAEVREYSGRFSEIRGLALPPPQSRRLIEEARGEFQ